MSRSNDYELLCHEIKKASGRNYDGLISLVKKQKKKKEKKNISFNRRVVTILGEVNSYV